MKSHATLSILGNTTHDWLRKINVAYVPGPGASDDDSIVQGLLKHFRLLGHGVQETPTDDTDVILTTARFGEPLTWRESLLFTGRKKFKLNHTPTIYTLVKIKRSQFQDLVARFERILQKAPPDPADYDFSGLAPQAYRTLFEQGRRGGPILAVERLLQGWTKSIHILLVVGDDRPEMAYHFDLVGAYPKSEANDLDALYQDIVLRICTTLSTHEVTQHAFKEPAIPHGVWAKLDTPKAMTVAAHALGRRDFFTEMAVISNFVHVPAVTEGVASQYSEGCFATWDPALDALIATVTGSARPVDKGNITEDDLAVLVGVREGGIGAWVRKVEGKRNDPPSSESVEMMDMDSRLPRVNLDSRWNVSTSVPVIRSKLHGHRSIAAFDPERVEFVPLDDAYYHYLVACATEAQARGIKAAFARSEALQNPTDPRQIVFTLLPGHGALLVEKWVPGKAPFQVLWEAMDAGMVEVSSRIPQGPLSYVAGANGRRVLSEDSGGAADIH